MTGPDPNQAFPLAPYEKLCFLKNIVKNPQIKVGDYTYYDDAENVENFEKNVKYLFDFVGDELHIGKFCMIAAGASFIMNGGNHLTDSFSAYPFAIFGPDWAPCMDGKRYPYRGNTVVGNDVWIGHKATIMPGVTIGDGAIIGSHSMVVKDVPPYSIVGGNPAKVLKLRFPEAIIEQLLLLKWWDLPIDEITAITPDLAGKDLDRLAELLDRFRGCRMPPPDPS